MRKLATIRIVKELTEIPGADAIVAASVDGWKCVVKKGEFNVGEFGVYFEIDSFLPAADERYAFLAKQFITFEGEQGARLRTIRLRKQLSQGLILPLSLFPELDGSVLGDDVSDKLGIKKWEPTIPAQLAGEVEGLFPTFIRKTDQERIQNLEVEIAENQGNVFEQSVKLDGTSMTVYLNHGKAGVCGRNWELRETESNSLWRTARKSHLIDALHWVSDANGGINLAFQGELIGEGIQGNPEKIKGQEFYLYDIWDIDNQRYISSEDRKTLLHYLETAGFKINHVPVLDEEFVLNSSVEDLLILADGPSLNTNEKREGLVYKRKDGNFSFKTISNWYLEKHGDR